ncbi:MAG TPA: hypothetical protein VFR49_02070, partial [Solirubrobacteraceae bacterium]|nr:hypothetical protein [Solirubrobacteraceae bacterium]
MTLAHHRLGPVRPWAARGRLAGPGGPGGLLGLIGLVAVAGVVGLTAVPAVAAPALPVVPSGFRATVFATAPLTTPATAGPDDIARLGANVFVGWQNGVGTFGEPNPATGETSSTVVEYAPGGGVVQSFTLA